MDNKTYLKKNSETLHNAMERKLWLNYFNNYLRDNGIITEDKWRMMRRCIG